MGMVVQRRDHRPADYGDLLYCGTAFNVSHSLLIPYSDERVDFVETVESPTGWIFP
jgi:hypothetical protein